MNQIKQLFKVPPSVTLNEFIQSIASTVKSDAITETERCLNSLNNIGVRIKSANRESYRDAKDLTLLKAYTTLTTPKAPALSLTRGSSTEQLRMASRRRRTLCGRAIP